MLVTISLGAHSVLQQPLTGALLPPHLHSLGTPPLGTDPGWPYPFISVAPDLPFALLQSACPSPSSPIPPFSGNSLLVLTQSLPQALSYRPSHIISFLSFTNLLKHCLPRPRQLSHLPRIQRTTTEKQNTQTTIARPDINMKKHIKHRNSRS